MSRTCFVGLIALISFGLVGCNRPEPTKANVVATPKDLKITDVKVGDGTLAEVGDEVLVHYTGTLTNGTEFDSNESKDTQGMYEKLPLGFRIGSGEMIKGWDQGVVGMKVGGIRKLVVPPELGYGANGRDKIPPNATLNFTVTLVDVVKKGEEKIMDITDKKVGTGRAVKPTDKIEISYISKLANGFVYEDSRSFDQSMDFKLDDKMVSQSIRDGILGGGGTDPMKVGGVRVLRLPYGLWSGAGSRVFLPPPQVLYYEITLKKVF